VPYNREHRSTHVSRMNEIVSAIRRPKRQWPTEVLSFKRIGNKRRASKLGIEDIVGTQPGDLFCRDRWHQERSQLTFRDRILITRRAVEVQSGPGSDQ
jgi:hypothetical protein